MEVDPKKMSLDDLIKNDKSNKPAGRGGRGGGDRRGGRGGGNRGRGGGVRDKVQGGRPRFGSGDRGGRQRPSDNFRARKTSNAIQKDKNSSRGGRNFNDAGYKVSSLFCLSSNSNLSLLIIGKTLTNQLTKYFFIMLTIYNFLFAHARIELNGTILHIHSNTLRMAVNYRPKPTFSDS